MKKEIDDISDDEIRVISAKPMPPSRREQASRTRRRKIPWIPIVIFLLIIFIIALLIWAFDDSDNELDVVYVEEPVAPDVLDGSDSDAAVEATVAAKPAADGYVTMHDTIVAGSPLVVLEPRNLRASLDIGEEVLTDSAVVMAFQAADIRRDNGNIVGAFVKDGVLLSRGQSKAGFCAIINGKITLGVAESTPYFEQTIESDGFFFRQYPLVVGGQIIENKPKQKALRKALAEVNGQIAVILSRERMTFHDFSEALVNMGVSTAIYLVGSSAYGFTTLENGEKVEFGIKAPNQPGNVSYIVWKK